MDESIFLVAKKLKNAAFGENLLQEKNVLDFGLLKRGRKSCRAKRCKRVRPYSLRNSQLNTMIQIMALSLTKNLCTLNKQWDAWQHTTCSFLSKF